MPRISPTTRISRSLITSVVIAGLVATPAFLAPPPARAAFPGYTGRIAFQMTNLDHGTMDIYTINADGTGLTNLTNDPANDSQASWSPDGTKLVFRSDRDGNDEIYMMNADGSTVVRLTNDPANDRVPAWSPDGTRIAFASDRDGLGLLQLYVMDADGSNQTRLTNSSAIDTVPNWSPDGSTIVYRHGNGAGSVEREVFAVGADGSNGRNLTDNAVSDENGLWSPDGSKIVFQSGRDGNQELYVMDADGGNQTRLTDNPADDGRPSYAPDGTKIAFQSDRDGGGIYWMNLDGTGVKPVILGTGAAYPDWQPVPNQAPVAANDNLTVAYNTATEKAVLANDTDEEALSGSHLAIIVQPAHGSAVIESGKVKYTPAVDYLGADSLTYQICDSFLLDQKCSTAVLGITVQAGPKAAIPTITSVGIVSMNGDSTVYYTGHRPTFRGTAEPGSTVKVEIHSDPIMLTTTADGEGFWSVTPDQDIPDGHHTVTIAATLAGSTSEPLTFTLGINTFIPDTGAPTGQLRGWGMALVVIGAGLYLAKRRQPRRDYGHVPPLFPQA